MCIHVCIYIYIHNSSYLYVCTNVSLFLHLEAFAEPRLQSLAGRFRRHLHLQSLGQIRLKSTYNCTRHCMALHTSCPTSIHWSRDQQNYMKHPKLGQNFVLWLCTCCKHRSSAASRSLTWSKTSPKRWNAVEVKGPNNSSRGFEHVWVYLTLQQSSASKTIRCNVITTLLENRTVFPVGASISSAKRHIALMFFLDSMNFCGLLMVVSHRSTKCGQSCTPILEPSPGSAIWSWL